MFEGFEQANTTPVPDILFDELLAELTGAELKVLLYIIRRTSGFKKDTDAISLSQFQKGITTKDGRVLDKGCGIKDRTTLVQALNSLQKKGCIKTEKVVKTVNEKQEHDTTVYKIKFKEGSREIIPPLVGNTHYPSREIHTTRSREIPLPVVGKSYPQETVVQLDSIQETVRQEVRSDSASAEVASTSPLTLEKSSQRRTRKTTDNQPALLEQKTEGKPEEVFNTTQLEWFNTVWCKSVMVAVRPRKVRVSLREAVIDLSEQIQTVEQLNSLYQFVYNLPFMKDKTVYPGNLANNNNIIAWKQSQAPSNQQGGTKSPREMKLPELVAYIMTIPTRLDHHDPRYAELQRCMTYISDPDERAKVARARRELSMQVAS